MKVSLERNKRNNRKINLSLYPKKAVTFSNIPTKVLKDSLSTFNPLLTNVPLLYLLKTSENRRFSDVFRDFLMFSWGVEVEHWLGMGQFRASGK